jgi:hypothetical protein
MGSNSTRVQTATEETRRKKLHLNSIPTLPTELCKILHDYSLQQSASILEV